MARYGGSDDLVRLVVIGGVGYVSYDFARKGKLGESAKKFADEIAKLISPGAGDPALPSGTDQEVATWARGIGLSYEVGRRFKAAFGRLPNTLDELNNWGNSQGLRNPTTGQWSI